MDNASSSSYQSTCLLKIDVKVIIIIIIIIINNNDNNNNNDNSSNDNKYAQINK